MSPGTSLKTFKVLLKMFSNQIIETIAHFSKILERKYVHSPFSQLLSVRKILKVYGTARLTLYN